MRYINTILLICLSLSFAKAQVITNNKRIADVYFINNEYYAAAEYYKKALHISPDTAGFVVPYGFEKAVKEESKKKEDYEYATFQLATSLRLYKNFQDAESWYGIATGFTNPKYALSGYWYAECLRANSKYDEAIAAFTKFIESYTMNDGYKRMAKSQIESCKLALSEIQFPRLYKLTKLAAEINGQGSNYAPFFSENTFYFTSSRPVGNGGKSETLVGDSHTKVVKKETPFINTLYSTTANPDGGSVQINKVLIDPKKLEMAAPALTPNGNFIYFTAWTLKPERKRVISFSQKLENNEWSAPISLDAEINANGFNSMQPFITKDGKYLVFSSDRPGGSGKYDLWYASLNHDGTAGSAKNLGPKVNSVGDDEAPYYNEKTKKLLFSSNGRVGLGGLDFYESTGDFTTWTEPRNMGYPFNSPKDDVYFTSISEDDKEGYVSSDRESICCLELFHLTRQVLTIRGKLIDCVTLKPIEGATVTLTGKNFDKQTALTDAVGMYTFGINDNRGLKINARKDLYFAKNLTYTYTQLVNVDTLKTTTLCLVPFKIDKPIVLENILYEFNSAELTETSKVTLNVLYELMMDNQNINIELGAHTDGMGSPQYNLGLSDRRAKSCVDYLVSKGISVDRMTSRGYGLTMPVAPNKNQDGSDNPAGRALNRRTEFKVTKAQ